MALEALDLVSSPNKESGMAVDSTQDTLEKAVKSGGRLPE